MFVFHSDDIRNVKIQTWRTTILPAFLYGCEIWSLTLMEVRRSALILPLPPKGFSVLYSTQRSKAEHCSFSSPLGLLKCPCPQSSRRSGYMICWRPLRMFLSFLTVLPSFVDHTVFPNLPENLFTSGMASPFTPSNGRRNVSFLPRGYVVRRSSALTRV
jgi:hypothetical protein